MKPSKKTQKTCWNKIWYFIWYDESILSWLANILIAFILIKYIMYPVLGLMLGTNLPIVAVISESMEHKYDFDEWWDSTANCNNKICSQEDFYEAYGITKEDFLDFRFKNGFNKGDIIILLGSDPEKIEVGEVIIFNSLATLSYPVIHRVVDVRGNETLIFTTKGDNNARSIVSQNLDETNVLESDLIGKGMWRIPYVGYVKLWFVDLINLFRPS